MNPAGLLLPAAFAVAVALYLESEFPQPAIAFYKPN